MSTTYQIAEVAQRTGFTPATLRYYEGIGLVTPASRTEAGYRVYDDASLHRLRFIARAKQLGCSLPEISELSAAWDGGQCEHVRDRLRATVEAKVSYSQPTCNERPRRLPPGQPRAPALTPVAAPAHRKRPPRQR